MTEEPNNQEQSSQEKPLNAHEIDYIIQGSELQFVEIVLDPGETVVSEAGSMMYMQQGIQMQTKMGDGSEKNSGLVGTLMGMGKRALTGEDMFLTFFTNNGQGRLKAAFAAPYPGMIIPLDLAQLGGAVLCQKGAFLCGARGVSIDVGLTKRVGAGLFGGEGFVLQKIQGDGLAFIHAGGAIIEHTLQAGETMYVDTGSLVAFNSSVKFDIQVITGIKNMLFGGEEFFLSTLTGPGKIWVQSMPYKRLVATIHNSMLEMQKKKK